MTLADGLKDKQSDDDIIKLTDEQILMLQLSDEDIHAGRTISQELLDKNDLEWLARERKAR
jgi:hypothetical protein